jgi:hypothetical protein
MNLYSAHTKIVDVESGKIRNFFFKVQAVDFKQARTIAMQHTSSRPLTEFQVPRIVSILPLF